MTNHFDNADTLIEATGITVTRGKKEILSSAGVRVRGGEIVTLIGPNGAGKTRGLGSLQNSSYEGCTRRLGRSRPNIHLGIYAAGPGLLSNGGLASPR